MKQIIALILLLAMMITVTGCVFTEISTETKPLSTVKNSDPDQAESGEKISDESCSDSAENPDEPEYNGTGETEESKSQNNEDPAIEKTVLYDKDNIRVTAVSIVQDAFGWSLRILTENNTDKDITISTDYAIVNNYMMTDFYVGMVPAGKKSTDDMTITASFLKETGITKIGRIEASFYVYEDDKLYDICTFKVDIKTNLYDVMDSGEVDGVLLYDSNGVKITGKYSQDSIFGPQLTLYAENNNDYDVQLTDEDLSVNGYAVSSIMSERINAGKKSICCLTIMQTDLDRNEVENVEYIEMKIKAFNPDTYRDYFETEILRIYA